MLLFLGMATLPFSSCGYRFSGGGTLPSGVKQVFIPVLENRTSEAGIETFFANDLVDEFTRAGVLVTSSSEGADALLKGGIRSISIETISHGAQQFSLEKRIYVVLDVRLESKTGRVLKEYRGLSESETFDSVAEQRPVIDKNQREAIYVISKRLAEMIYKMLTDDF